MVEQPVAGETALVQAKSVAAQASLDEYVARFEADPALSRLIFVCHAPAAGPCGGDRDLIHDKWVRERGQLPTSACLRLSMAVRRAPCSPSLSAAGVCGNT